MKVVEWIENLRKEDVALAGGKGANLGEMTKTFPIPNAFVITAETFNFFLKDAGIQEKVLEILRRINVEDSRLLDEKSAQVRELIVNASLPWETEVEILDAYKKLGSRRVAVRSSATAEDLPGSSFAGQQETFLNITNEKSLIGAIKKCWASLYTSRAIFYREKRGFEHEEVSIGVIVQKMVDSEISGVMFTSHPISGEPQVVIEAGRGLGESVVGGKITPDTYVVAQANGEILDKTVSSQHTKYITGKEGTEEVEVKPELQDKQKLSDELIKELAEIGKSIEEHYGIPMDVEWCVEGGKIYVVQARPSTSGKEKKEEEVEVPVEKEVLVRGLSASPGMGVGEVCIIQDATQLDKVKEGNILVAKATAPDMVPAMRRASAIVTNEGGMTCHAAIVSRELGIPCIVGSGEATEKLEDGMLVTVEASAGVVYEGKIKEEVKGEEELIQPTAAPIPITGTKILLNLGVPEKAEEYAKLPVEGVGLMREEFTVISYVGEHPCALIEANNENKFIDKLAEGIRKVAKAFYPKPVVLRTSDFKTNEYRTLKGGDKYEVEEANPMLGWRGVSRYVSERYEKAFRLELRAIKKIREEGLKNVWVMLPFARTPDEVKKTLEVMSEEGLERGKDLKVWIMAEIPSNIFLADRFAELCDGFSIGSNDLTQLVLGVDRDSEMLGKLGYFDERDEAVKRAISHLIKVAHEHGCTVSICGQAPSVYPEFTEFLVKEGIDSISLNPDAVEKTVRLVASMERKLIMEGLKQQR